MRTMFDPQVAIKDIEQRLKHLNHPIPDFVRAAGVHPSTWRRWAAGDTAPNFSTWKKIDCELRRLEGQTVEAAE